MMFESFTAELQPLCVLQTSLLYAVSVTASVSPNLHMSSMLLTSEPVRMQVLGQRTKMWSGRAEPA